MRKDFVDEVAARLKIERKDLVEKDSSSTRFFPALQEICSSVKTSCSKAEPAS